MAEKEAKVRYVYFGDKRMVQGVWCIQCKRKCKHVNSEEAWHGENIYHTYQCPECGKHYGADDILVDTSE